MEQNIRWKQRFENYKKALSQLESAVKDYADTDIAIIKEGVIQRFEFTHELAWKVMQDYLRYQGFTDVGGPRGVTKLAFNQGLIMQGDSWIDMLQSRNLTVHTYDETLLEQEFHKITHEYVLLLSDFKIKMEQLCHTSD